MATWREHLQSERAEQDDTTAIVAVAPAEAVLDVEFDDGYKFKGEGPPVLVWSESRVYFPMEYDGSEWIRSAPRNPQPEGQPHVRS